MDHASTIFALATAQGRAGVAVVRVSGAHAQDCITQLCVPNELPEPRKASLRKIQHPQTGDLIDHAPILWFEAPNSFTGEDVVEFHIHGGKAILHALTEVLRALPHTRMAEAGEFTRRAFENGKLDLTEAEAIADLIHADTEAQRRQAMRQFEGALGRVYESWRTRLIRVLAYLEAAIDFSDEDLPAEAFAKQKDECRCLIREIETHLNDSHRGERLREGFSIAILGPPNAGKSSLLNCLAQREAAIVSSIAGTTRDVIEVHLDLGGFPVTLADTAGLRESVDLIENEGVRRALARAELADLKLLVFDGATWPEMDSTTQNLIDANTLVVVNKADLIEEKTAGSAFFISAQSGQGIPDLLTCLVKEIDQRFADTGTPPLTRERHRAALEECLQHMNRSLAAREPELQAEDIRLAMRALGRITGRVDVEDLLDVIFRDFCIGK